MLNLHKSKTEYASCKNSRRLKSKGFVTIIIFTVAFSLVPTLPAAANTGSLCTKKGAIKIVKNIRYKCLFINKHLQWQKQAGAIKNSQSEIAPVNTTQSTNSNSSSSIPSASTSSNTNQVVIEKFRPPLGSIELSNLVDSHTNIAKSSWALVSRSVIENPEKPISYEILTGPNSKPFYDDWALVISKASKFFIVSDIPKNVLIIRYNFQDSEWADSMIKTKLKTTDYEWLTASWNEKTNPAKNNCNDKPEPTCIGSRQKLLPSGTSLILEGIPSKLGWDDPTIEFRYRGGVLESHELMHSFQTNAMLGKDGAWPPHWMMEGAAEYLGSSMTLSASFEDFALFRKQEATQLFQTAKFNNSNPSDEKFILDYLNSTFNEYGNYDRMYSYNLGFFIMESLFSIYGRDSYLKFFSEMSSGPNHDQCMPVTNGSCFLPVFKRVFGDDWSTVTPILAKAISLNLTEIRL